jgi:DNA-binding transcriptional LysR family regulator
MQNSESSRIGLARDLDLNQMKVLHTLIETQSVTRTGEILGLSQPAASRAISKLRDTLGDPLLVRISKGYTLTSRAESLRETVELALEAASRVFIADPLNPVESNRTFHVGATDYGTMSVLNPILPLLQRLAPAISLSIYTWTNETLFDIERGRLDFILHAGESLPADFYAKRLYREHYVLIVRKDHPLTQSDLRSHEDLQEACMHYRQLVTIYPTGRGFKEDNFLERFGLKALKAAVAVPYFCMIPPMLAESDLFSIVPARVFESFKAHFPIARVSIPGDQDEFNCNIIWHKRINNDPVFNWLKALIVGETRRRTSAQ